MSFARARRHSVPPSIETQILGQAFQHMDLIGAKKRKAGDPNADERATKHVKINDVRRATWATIPLDVKIKLLAMAPTFEDTVRLSVNKEVFLVDPAVYRKVLKERYPSLG